MYDTDDISNPSQAQSFEEIGALRMSRRGVIVGGRATAAFAFAGRSAVAEAAGAMPRHGNGSGRGAVGFTSIPLQNGPMPTVAPEYEISVILPWREKLDGSGESFEYAGFTAEQQEQSIGIGHDGMWFFGDDRRGLLCLNHEFGVNQHVFGAEIGRAHV